MRPMVWTSRPSAAAISSSRWKRINWVAAEESSPRPGVPKSHGRSSKACPSPGCESPLPAAPSTPGLLRCHSILGQRALDPQDDDRDHQVAALPGRLSQSGGHRVGLGVGPDTTATGIAFRAHAPASRPLRSREPWQPSWGRSSGEALIPRCSACERTPASKALLMPRAQPLFILGLYPTAVAALHTDVAHQRAVTTPLKVGRKLILPSMGAIQEACPGALVRLRRPP